MGSLYRRPLYITQLIMALFITIIDRDSKKVSSLYGLHLIDRGSIDKVDKGPLRTFSWTGIY